MTTAINKISPGNPMLTTRQVAKMLGCHRRSVGRYEQEGLTSYTKGGKCKRFYLKEVQRFIEVNYVRATVKKEDKNTDGAIENAGKHKNKMALTA